MLSCNIAIWQHKLQCYIQLVLFTVIDINILVTATLKEENKRLADSLKLQKREQTGGKVSLLNLLTYAQRVFLQIHNPEKVVTNGHAKILWDLPIQTDKHLLHNRPDIVLINYKEQTGLIIDIVVPRNKNIQDTKLKKI